MFTYTAWWRLAQASDIELELDEVSGFERDDAYQRHYQLNNFCIPGCWTTADACATSQSMPMTCAIWPRRITTWEFSRSRRRNSRVTAP